jgi:hypothetical protein
MTLTLEQRRTRANEMLAEHERTGCDMLTAMHRVNARWFGETAPTGRPATETAARPAARPPARGASAKPAKGAKRAARIAKAVSESLAATQAARSAARQNAPQAPVRELHEMSTDELAETAAAAYRAVGEGGSPFWESAPPGVRQGPAGATGPAVNPIPAPPPDPATPLHNMSSEDWEAASAAWYADAARAGHSSPFWQAS